MPSWQAALGESVVGYPPQSESPGRDEPGEAVEGLLAEAKAKDLVGECAYRDAATPKCYTSTNPAAIFSAGDKTFSQLWSEAANGSSSVNMYTLAPAVFVNGGWYLYD